jgi:hypothetical protein
MIQIASVSSATILLIPSAVWAAKDPVGIAPVVPTPALAESVKKEGKANQMDQVLQALDDKLVNRIHSTQKFDVLARGDLKVILTEQALANSGNVDAADKNAAQQFKLAGAKYMLATKVTGFKDVSETRSGGETGGTVTIRVLSLSAVTQIYDSTTGKLHSSADFQIRKEDRRLSQKLGSENAALSDELLAGIAGDMADKLANRIVGVLFPPKIIAKTDKQVTINRGDGTDVSKGERWKVYKVGRELKDPDSGEVLGVEEIEVGEVEIMSVLPKFSTAKILGDDTKDIVEGSIVRPITAK